MGQPTRVLYVHNSADLYGASRSLLRLVKNLDRARFAPVVLLPEKGALADLLQELSAEVLIDPRISIITRRVFHSAAIFPFLARIPRNALVLRKLIRTAKIDLVHTNTGVVLSGGLATRLAGVPHVWHLRDWFQEFKSFWIPYARYMQWSSTFIIAISEAVAAQFSNRDKVVVIHNGFPMEEFHADKNALRREFRDRYNLGQDEFVVGCVGRIKFVRKGQEVLVQAAARLKQKGRRAKFVIVGAPFADNADHLQQLQALIRELNVEDIVLLTGELADVKPAYAAMDISVMPSAQPEPLGGVVLESMAMGIPVIATNIGGPLEMIQEGATGFLVPPLDPAALAAKIEELMDNPDLRNCVGAAGSGHVTANFSVAKKVHEIMELYDRALAAPRR